MSEREVMSSNSAKKLDQWDEVTERLLPCLNLVNWPYRKCNYLLCDRCMMRPAVAAELRGMGQRIEELEAALKEKPYSENLWLGNQRDTCVYLKNGEKIVIKRDGKRCWLEILPQSIISSALEKK